LVRIVLDATADLELPVIDRHEPLTVRDWARRGPCHPGPGRPGGRV